MFQKQLSIPFSARRRPCEEPGFAYKVYEVFCMQRCLLQGKRREKTRKLHGRMFKLWRMVSS